MIRLFPVTIALLTVIVGVGRWTAGLNPAAHARLLRQVGLDYEMIRSGAVYHIVTGTFFQSEPGIAGSMILLVGSALIPCELLAGSWRTLITFLATDWASSLLTVLALRGLSLLRVDEATSLLAIPDAGSSAAAHGAFAVAAMLLPGRLASIAYGALFGTTVVLFWYQSLAPALAHFFAVLIGGVMGWAFRQRTTNRQAAEPRFPAAASSDR